VHNRSRISRLRAALAAGPLLLATAGVAAGGQPASAAAESPGAPPHWPAWRGPTANGVSTDTGLPVRFDPQVNGLWRAETPGEGHSSPVVWGDRVFVSAAIAGDPIPGHEPPVHYRNGELYLHGGSTDGNLRHTLLALAYDARTGREVWRRTVHDGPVYDNKYRTNTYASLTPVTDGERVYFSFGNQGLFAFTLEGDPVWQTDVGDFGVWGLGHGINPVLHGEVLILVCDNDDGEGSRMFGVDRRTGEIVWSTERHARKGWATPALLPVGVDTQLFVPGYHFLAAYDPKSGAELWRTAPFADSAPVHTPVHQPLGDGRLVFVSTGYPGKEMRALEVLPGVEPRVRWTYERGTGYLPSALLYRGILFFLSDGGVITALDPEDGSLHFQARPTNPGRYNSSPIGYEGQVLIGSLEGDLTVFRAAEEFEIVAESSLPEALWASPAIAGGTLFLRSVDALYAFRSPTARDTTPAR
jgi:outer membrane protein assembly factor BamB